MTPIRTQLDDVFVVIRANEGPIALDEIMSKLNANTTYNKDDVLEVVWYLIERGYVDLTRDRKYIWTGKVGE